MTEKKIDNSTGEVILQPPEISTDLVLGSGVAVMSPEQAKKAVDYLQDIQRSILKQGIDYGKIPGMKKPTLYKAGAQKLCAFFNLAATYETEAVTEQPENGFYSYRMKCSLHHRHTGQLWGSGIGIAMSSEAGRERNPANTLIKMAQKRAFLQATLDATFSSELFTQDVEDYAPSGTMQAKSPQEFTGDPNKPCSEKQYNLIIKLKDDPLKELPPDLLASAQNFCMTADLQTNGNAKLLIDKLLKAPNRNKRGRAGTGEPLPFDEGYGR